MNCCICGTVKNCGPYLYKVLENMEKIGSLFENYVIILFYDQSSDNTLQILKDYKKNHPERLIFYNNFKEVSPYRTYRLAHGRNECLKIVRENMNGLNQINTLYNDNNI